MVSVQVTATGSPTSPTDATAPSIRMMVLVRRALRPAGLRLRVGCNELCTLALEGRVFVGSRRIGKLVLPSRPVQAGRRATLVLRLTKRLRGRALRAFGERTVVRVRITVTATDGAGNRSTARRAVTLVP